MNPSSTGPFSKGETIAATASEVGSTLPMVTSTSFKTPQEGEFPIFLPFEF